MPPQASDAIEDGDCDHEDKRNQMQDDNRVGDSDSSPRLPDWARAGQRGDSDWGETLRVPEWQDEGGEYRRNNGWKGRDLVHDRDSPVRVLDYYVNYGRGISHANQETNDGEKHATNSPAAKKNATEYKTFVRGGVGTTLTGIVHFTKRAESHQGYCHGGSMCSIMDDVIGWVGFLVTGKCIPWSGFTVQVNSKLQRPIHVDSVLMVRAKITSVERRKVSIEAVIKDPKHDENGGCIHATASGLVVVNRGVLCGE
mmetsp:Transcript_16595/g.34174  ORF Transcript_16595/g.34174 Transcript_16595/m.34174 type:complete len:255 (+) Transcript_16595:337-1101(+)|eukprot:CAMPEP_0201126872 /NCGR_PEP_ID=MMETSP0850-20130426/27816_1 /ASSEMBLY_ACC=CAM_ASM_000622 /TAXON_ID=183588 /ORGANISM="Pseudo-nitzschia fraudulenta, Strain WWA7" /LENGTH=254 /DNA_ID=CAMNT_0047395491 /DNA_START=249 /DNA_END=1013 /DNA_ORIENTATION=+